MTQKKIAFFVEGYTEVFFVKRALEEYMTSQKIAIDILIFSGGKRFPRVAKGVLPSVSSNSPYYAIIYNSCNENSVVSDIIGNYTNLFSHGYSKIIGIRDIYPHSYNYVSTISLSLLPKDKNIKLVFSKMEIEAWVLSDPNHYMKYDERLTKAGIKNAINTTPEQISRNVEKIYNPAKLLKKIYNSSGVGYRKSQKQSKKIVGSLDYAVLMTKRRNKNMNYFFKLLTDFWLFAICSG
jgi:hypothetical protein